MVHFFSTICEGVFPVHFRCTQRVAEVEAERDAVQAKLAAASSAATANTTTSVDTTEVDKLKEVGDTAGA